MAASVAVEGPRDACEQGISVAGLWAPHTPSQQGTYHPLSSLSIWFIEMSTTTALRLLSITRTRRAR